MFAIGQKVRCVDSSGNQQHLVHGQEYTVLHTFDDGDISVEGLNAIYMHQRFVAADSGPPDFDFKVNDWVLCVDAEDCDGLLCDGAVYRITDIRGEFLVLGHTDNVFSRNRFMPWLTAAKIQEEGMPYNGFTSDVTRYAGQDETARRKAQPVCTGVLDYFPDALLAVSRLSQLGNDKYNPGQPMHHARGKSMDHADALLRHHMARGTIDPDTGLSHSVGVAWRALAQLQEELEAAGAPLARGARK